MDQSVGCAQAGCDELSQHHALIRAMKYGILSQQYKDEWFEGPTIRGGHA